MAYAQCVRASLRKTHSSPLANRLLATYTANIPKCIKNGEYLLRIQSLAIHNPGSMV